MSLLKVVKNIQKRYYNKNNKTLYLRIEENKTFIDSLSDPEFEFEDTESNTVVLSRYWL